jgi:hypothetical protein
MKSVGELPTNGYVAGRNHQEGHLESTAVMGTRTEEGLQWKQQDDRVEPVTGWGESSMKQDGAAILGTRVIN